jgi:hypothetical protein
MRRPVLVALLVAALLLALAGPATAQTQPVAGLSCPDGTQARVVVHYPELRVEVVDGQRLLHVTIVCPGQPNRTQLVPFTYQIEPATRGLFLTFTAQGADAETTVRLFVTDSSQARQFDRLARQLENASTPAQEARLLNELLALLSV